MATKDHWFHSKSPAAQKAYIAAHPNSIYAKGAKKGSKAAPAADKAKAMQAYRKLENRISDLEDREPKGGAAFVRWEAKLDAMRKELKTIKKTSNLKVASPRTAIKASKNREAMIAKIIATDAGQAIAAKLARLKKTRSRMTLWTSGESAAKRKATQDLIAKRDANIKKLEDKLHDL